MADDPTYASTVAQMSALILSWQTYIDQQRQLVNGDPSYVTATPPGQPGPGYYPLTDPAGLTGWAPCPARTQADATSFRIIARAAVNQQIPATDSGALVRVSNTGGTTTVKLTFPAGLGAGFNAIYYWEGTQALMGFYAGSGVTIIQDQGNLTKVRGPGSLVFAFCPVLDTVVLSGSLIP